MAVDLEFIKGMVEMQGRDCYFEGFVIMNMVEEIDSLRADIVTFRAELTVARDKLFWSEKENAEHRASLKAKQETIDT